MYTTDNALTTLACSIPAPLLFGDQHGTRRCFGGGSTLGDFLNRFGGGHQGICQELVVGTEPRSTQLSCIPKSWICSPMGVGTRYYAGPGQKYVYWGGRQWLGTVAQWV